MVIVSIYGYISLAQFNPSVTLAFIVRDYKELPRSDWFQWSMYFVSQFAGGICGGYFAWLAGGKDACLVYTAIDTNRYTVWQAFYSELFFCCMLVTVNLHVAADVRMAGNHVYAAAIGMILTVSALSVGEISGSAVNTAVWAGTVASAAACVDYYEEGESVDVQHWWVYWVSHTLAGLISGAWFVLIYGDGMDGDPEDAADIVVNPMTPIAHLHRAGSIGNPSSRNLYARIDSNEENQGRPSVEMAKKDKLGKREERRSGSVVEELLATPVPAGGVVELPSTIDLTHSMSDTMSPKK